MNVFLKILVGFWIIWFIWYLTGGPIRSTTKYPLIKYKDTAGPIYGTSSKH